MPKCTFCGSEKIRKMHVKVDGALQYFCSAKCEKNMKLGRNPRRTNWVRKALKAVVPTKA